MRDGVQLPCVYGNLSGNFPHELLASPREETVVLLLIMRGGLTPNMETIPGLSISR